MSRIAVCTHVFEAVNFDVYFNHVYCVANWSKKYDLVFVGKSGLDAATARNKIIDTCFEQGCTHALFIDGDHFVPAETLDFLMENQDAAMVSGVICKKGERFQQVAWEIHPVKGVDNFFEVTLPLDGHVYEVHVCAFGCTLINLEKIKRLQKPYFRDTCDVLAEATEAQNIRSDINLCKAFRAIGEKMFVDTRILVGHLGVPTIVYPQSAGALQHLRATEKELWKLREGQTGVYYIPGGRNE